MSEVESMSLKYRFLDTVLLGELGEEDDDGLGACDVFHPHDSSIGVIVEGGDEEVGRGGALAS